MSIPTQSESSLVSQILDYAALRGWLRCHFRPARTAHGWRTAIMGDVGFPDIVLVRDRLIFAETKAARGKLRPEQEQWITQLRYSGQEVYIWRPSDWPEIERTLR